MKKILLSISLLFLSSNAFAATYYFCTSAGANWSTGTNWTTVSADQGTCAASGTAPTSSDTAILNSSSGNVTIDTTSDVAGVVTATGYTGTMTFTLGDSLTVSGNVTWGSGMTITGTGTLVFGAASTYTSNGVSFSGNWSIGAFTVTLADTTETLVGNLSLTGNATINTDTLDIGGSLSPSTFTLLGTTTLVMDGTGTWSGTGSITNPLTFNTAGTITVSGTVGYKGTLTYTTGTMVVTNSTLSLGGSPTLNTSGMSWNNLEFADGNSAVNTFSSTLNVSGTCLLPLPAGVSYTISGNLSCGYLNSLGTTYPNNNETVKITAGDTITITQGMYLAWSGTFGFPSIKSATTSSPFTITYTGTAANCQVTGIAFTDVTFTGTLVIDYYGSLLRTTGISNFTQANFYIPGTVASTGVSIN